MENSTLHEPIMANDLEALQTALADPELNLAQRDSEGRGFLHRAVLIGAELPILKALAERVDLAPRDINGQTFLDLAPAESGLREAVDSKLKELVLAGGEVGEKEVQRLLLAGWSHLPITAEEAKEKSEEAVQLLDKLMELKDKVGQVHKAVKEGRLEDLKGLLDLKLLATAVDHSGLPPLQGAVLHRQREIVKYLIADFADVINVTDNMGRTALHYAAATSADDSDLYEALKTAGADDTVTDLAGKTAEDYQQQPDLLPVADILKRLAGPSADTQAADTEQAALAAADATAAPTQSDQDSAAASQQHLSEDANTTTTNTPPKTPTPPPPPEPAKPVQVTPVNMYVRAAETDRAPPPSTVDGKYVAQHLGTALTLALAEIAEKRPWDPIEYLGQWLYKYRKNLDEVAQQQALLGEIRAEEEAANEEEVTKFKKREEELRIQEEDRRKREEEEAAKKKREQEELQRQAREAMLAQKPQLPTVTEEEAEDTVFRERDGLGQTELHVLAAQSGADLMAVMNLGYSLADRDINNKTPRDVAEEHGLTENVETIDNYVSNLLEQEKLDTLNQLVVEGYDKLDAVLDKVSTEGLPESVTDFVKSISELQEQVAATFRAVSSGVTSDVEGLLEGNAAVGAKDLYGRSPLHLAILADHTDIAKAIVNRFPQSVKARDNMNRTPLHYAAALSEELSELLKASGADVNAKDAAQHIPSFYKDEKDDIERLRDTLPSQGTAVSGEISLAVPQIRADDDNQQSINDNEPDNSAADDNPRADDSKEEVTTATTTVS